MKKPFWSALGLASLRLASFFALVSLVQPALAQDKNNVFKLGIVTFMSGPGAESFGAPSWYAAQRLVQALNEGGQVPAPYDKVGFGGLKVDVSVIDESGGTTKQVQELRNAFQRDGYDAIIGYISSSNCLAAAPVAEELKKLLILFDCGTPRIFEDGSYQYVFRNSSHATMDNGALVRYVQKRHIKVDTAAGINPDYAYGRDNWKDFIQSLQKVSKDTKVAAELWPKLGAGQYGTEISAFSKQIRISFIPVFGVAICRPSFCRPRRAGCSRGEKSRSWPAIMFSTPLASACPKASLLARAAWVVPSRSRAL